MGPHRRPDRPAAVGGSGQGIAGGTLLNVGGIFGAALLGLLATRFALGIGRAGAILAPALAGVFLDGGATPQSLYLVVGVIFVAVAAVLTLLRAITPVAAPAKELA